MAHDRATDLVARSAVDAVLNGDREAFRVLVEREAPNVVRTCFRILGDFPEAEDAAQEAFVIAFRSLASWRSDGPFGAWLARIATRVALRRAAARREVAWIEASPRFGDEEDGREPSPPFVASALDDPVATALAGERSESVRRAVRALVDPYRETVILRFFADLPLADIAAATGRPLGTVKTHLHRGLVMLRDRLGDEVLP
jgi:RNA polymerase sigma-70 factor (ECF subfamily)